MYKKILILAITASFIISSIPLAEASISWNGFLRDIGFGGSQIYEVSGVSVIPTSSVFGNEVQLRCLDGDWFYTSSPLVVLSPEPPVSAPALIGAQTFVVNDGDISTNFFTRIIGYDVIPINQGVVQPFDITVTVTGLCFSPSPLVASPTVGGDWQATDTVALFIGYSVLNAYWLAPTLAGIGAGVYLTKSKWSKN